MDSIFDKFTKKLPPGHLTPQRAIMEQVIFNSQGNKYSDMRIDEGYFKVAIDTISDYSEKTVADKNNDEKENSFFKLELL